MKIEKIHIKNYRSFKDQEILMDDYTTFVGPNGAGKSNVLEALNVFFGESETELSEEDFHGRNTEEPIEITITFSDISDAVKEDLSDYVRKGEDERDKLIVSAIAKFTPNTGEISIKQVGSRLCIQEFAEFFKRDNDGAKTDKLLEIYESIRKSFPNLAEAKTKKKAREELKKYEEEHPSDKVLLRSSDSFYGSNKGKLNKHVQWVFVPAVKDATKEGEESRTSALKKLLDRTIRSKVNFEEGIAEIRKEVGEKYQEMINEQAPHLESLSKSLSSRLREWAHPEAAAKVIWDAKEIKIEIPGALLSAEEDNFTGKLVRFGHGLQRSCLLALLYELAEADNEFERELEQSVPTLILAVPTLILGFEEPELYQHPPQIRHLADTLQQLASNNTQIFLTTHNPLLISGKAFESVRMVRRTLEEETRPSNVFSTSFDDVALYIDPEKGRSNPNLARAKLHNHLVPQLAEMFFARKIILVEGQEDVAYIKSWLHMSGKLHEFLAGRAHIIPTDGKGNMIITIAIANLLKIPLLVIYDGDGASGVKTNRKLINLLGGNALDSSSEKTVWKDNFVQWSNSFEVVMKTDIGENDWEDALKEVQIENGLENINKKNSMLIAMHLEKLQALNKIPQSLETLTDRIINFVKDDT